MKATFVAFDRMTYLDFIGFYDAVTRLKSMKIMDDFEWRILAPTPRVVDDRGLKMEPDAGMESLASYDMLFVPGGMGTRPLQRDPVFIDWLKTGATAKLKVSVGRPNASAGITKTRSTSCSRRPRVGRLAS